MAVNKTQLNSVYGLTNPIQPLFTDPIVAKRNPTTKDTAPIGTLWVNKLSNAYYVATSYGPGTTNWQAQATGSGTFASVDVTGGAGTTFTVAADSALAGDLSVGGDTAMTGNLTVTGNVAVTGDFDITDTSAISLTSTANAAPAIYLHANGGVAETIELRADQGTALNSLYLLSDVGGIKLEAAGLANSAAINLAADAGGFKLDGVLASTLNVVGAAQDLSLNATGGSINLTATEAAADAIVINASDVAGKVAITGVGGITAATTNSAIAVTSGTGTVSISADATANALNLGTGAGAKVVSIGSATGASTVSILGGTAAAGSIHIGQSANAVPIIIGNVTGTTGVTINSGTSGIAMASTGAGDITLASSDTVLIDSAGVLELNSSAGIIGIGNDAVNQNINIGTAGARVVTVGSSTGASSVVVNCGTGACDLGTSATAHATSVGSTTAASTLALNTPAGTTVVAANGLSITTATAQLILPGPISIMTGAGAPANGLAVNVGDMYINTTAASAVTRLYIASAASTWVNVTCSA